jgi:hypothetical protein
VLKMVGAEPVIRGEVKSVTGEQIEVEFGLEETDVGIGKWMVVVMDQYGQTAWTDFEIKEISVKRRAASKE